MINRKLQPEIKEIDKIDFVAPVEKTITSKLKLYHMKDVSDETSRFDLYFNAGKLKSTRSVASLVNGLLLSGTEQKNSIEISEAINSLGGFIESGISAENAVFTVYCLRENIKAIFDIVYDAIDNLNFCQNEIDEISRDRSQKYKISMEKVNTLAQREFQSKLFASDERYSQIVDLDDYQNISRDELVDFHNTNIINGLERVVIVGDIDATTVDYISEKSKNWAATNTADKAITIQNAQGQFKVEKKDAIQSAIRVGRTLFNKDHEDYIDFLILNTIIGDYFGSRLMSNIREDKGYTYGIGSMLGELQNTGYFLIATEVRADAKDDTITQIKLELNRLQTELVSEEELTLVKNYMLGQLLKSADGAYAMMDLFLSVELHDKSLDFYNTVLSKLNAISAERIKELANKYFNWDDMTVVIAG